jgi:hypothetical protein
MMGGVNRIPGASRCRTFWTAALIAILPAAGSAQFVDVTDAANVANLGQFSTNLAWGDYDGDGDVDLYVTNWGAAEQPPPDRLYRNDLDDSGTVLFADVSVDLGLTVASNSTAAAWVDYDNDGDLDLYVADFFEQDRLYQGDGGQSFAEVGRSQLINNQKLGSVFAIGWGDYDNDGWLDLYLGKYYHDNELYHNVDGLLARVTDLGVGDRRDTNGITWVDYDNDGDLDLYVVNREQENGLYRNDLNAAEGVFTEIACALSLADAEIGQSGTWADYDNDGDLDLYVSNVGANALYRNDGQDTFTDQAAAADVDLLSSGWVTAMAAWADVNGDGWLDLYLANGADRQLQPDVLAAGSATGVFADSTGTASLPVTASAHLSVAFADIDTNGTPDLYVTDGLGPFGGGNNRLYQNVADDSLFLRVVVRGKGAAAGGANLYGYGAKVYLIDAVSNDTVAFQQVLPPMAVPRTVTSDDGTTAGGAEVIFGAPADAYNVSVLFPGNPQAGIGPNVSGGDVIVIDEP